MRWRLTVRRSVVLADSAHEYYLHRLTRPLAPGDSIVLNFDLAARTRGFANTVDNTDLASNGTFLENGAFMPGIGYEPRARALRRRRSQEGEAPAACRA